MKGKLHSLMPSKQEKKQYARPASKASAEDMLSTLNLSSDKVPNVKSLKVDDKCEIVLEAEVVGVQSGDLYGEKKDRKETTARFRIKAASVKPFGRMEYKGEKMEDVIYKVKEATDEK